MSAMKLTWKGVTVVETLTAQLTAKLDQYQQRVVQAAKAELRPGRGKLSGRLQASIESERASIVGGRIRGRVRTQGVPYAKIIHDRYGYITKGVEKAGSFS